jgi:uncharacterized protein
MSIGRRVVVGCCGWLAASVLVLIRAAPVVLIIIFVFSLPANAQFWGNSWGSRQPQQQYNPYGGGFGGNRQWDYWGYPQRERPPSPRLRERVEKEQPPDFSHAPPATPRKEATVKVVVMGDANADWLAYGLEEAFSEKPEIGIVRKHRTDSGLIHYDQRRDSEWPQVAREIIAAEKPKFIVMMIGNNDRQTIRDKAPPPAPVNARPVQPAPAIPRPPPDPERQLPEEQHPRVTDQARQVAYGPWEFRSEKWELAYIKRINATIAALKSAGVPVIWVGLPSQRSTKATEDSSYLNELYRSQAEKAGIVFVDVWDGFVDEAGKFSTQGPDYLGQTRRLRTSDGVYFTKFGARKLALYVEREIERVVGNKGVPVALPVPVGPGSQAPNAKASGAAQRPAAGPVVPLTDTRFAPEELMGGAGAAPAAATGATVTRALTKGDALAAPSGRADDFSWPRGVLNVEPAAVEPAVPDTAAADAGLKSAKPAQRKSTMDAYAAQRRPRPRLNHNPWAHQRPSFPLFGSNGW